MIVADGFVARDGRPVWCGVLVFGCGLLGDAIVGGIESQGGMSLGLLPFSWNDTADQGACADRIRHYLDERLRVVGERAYGPTRGRLAVVWSAGSGGFYSSEAQLQPEIDNFRFIVAFADRLFRRHPQLDHSFHMVGSAGGVFEGQIDVSPTSVVRPQRPYGWAKLSQEAAFTDWATDATKCCYRPSSVYGMPAPGRRIGLLPTLILRGMQHRQVVFSGGMETLRDFVANTDVGRFIAERILSGTRESRTYTLATAKPTSLFELKCAAESVLGRRIYARYDPAPSNAAHNSYLPSVLPCNWQPVDVSLGLRRIHTELLRQPAWAGWV